MDWNNPNHVAIFTGIGQWAGAIASFLAVVVAGVIALGSSKDSQKQSRQIRYDSARPVIIISGNNSVYTKNFFGNNEGAYISQAKSRGRIQTIYMQPGKRAWIDWNVQEHLITLQNVGNGTAFNLMSVIFGPESLADDDKLLDASKNDYWQCKINVLNVGEIQECTYDKCGVYLLKGNVGGYSFLAPPQPIIDPDDKKRLYSENFPVCRVITTYRDIFKRKHASIFDLDVRGAWIIIAVLEDISQDLYDLQKAHNI